MKKKLNAKDWALISEALEMLSLDYEGKHPKQAQIDEIQNLATRKGDFSIYEVQ